MPLGPQAPYDSLAIITQMVRALLGDFIANLQPNNTGVVTTVGTGVTWNSGDQFTAMMNDATMVINGVPYTVATVTSPTTLVLASSAGNQTSAYSLVIETGDIFADDQAYVVPICNLAYRKVQKALAYRGHPRFESTVILTALPVIANLDPGVEQYINWQGFYDGVTFWTPASLAGCPVLPQDFILPMHLDERQSLAGATAQNPNLNVFCPMHPAVNGLRSRVKGSWNREFDWRQDAIYFRGSILPMDIKARYGAYLADIAPGVSFATTPVPILGASESIANYAASIFVTPRGSQLGPTFDAAGDAALSKISSEAVKLSQRKSVSRIPWGSRFRRMRRGPLN